MTDLDELLPLLDAFTLAFAVHVTAESKVVAAAARAAPAAARVLGQLAANLRDEHADQQRVRDALAATRPASEAWFARALELRVLVLDHAARAEVQRWTLQDHVPVALHQEMASMYATERLRGFARTSPVALARAQLAVA